MTRENFIKDMMKLKENFMVRDRNDVEEMNNKWGWGYHHPPIEERLAFAERRLIDLSTVVTVMIDYIVEMEK